VSGTYSIITSQSKSEKLKNVCPKKDPTNQNPNWSIWHTPQERKDSYISRDIIRFSRSFLSRFTIYSSEFTRSFWVFPRFTHLSSLVFILYPNVLTWLFGLVNVSGKCQMAVPDPHHFMRLPNNRSLCERSKDLWARSPRTLPTTNCCIN